MSSASISTRLARPSCSASMSSPRSRPWSGRKAISTGRALTGQSHDYKRHGTTTLFAALDVATGKVLGEHKKRRRRVEFLGFMDKVVAAFPDRELHVVLESQYPQEERALAEEASQGALPFHPNASFLAQPDRDKSLSGASFTAVSQLQEHIDAFISAWNEKAEPFIWSKKKVRPTPLQRQAYHSALIPSTSVTPLAERL
jgi:hypothetical protein